MTKKGAKAGGTGTGRMLPVLALLLLGPVAHALEQPGGQPARVGVPDAPVQAIREPARPLADKTVDRIVQDIERKYRAKVQRLDRAVEDGREVLVLRLLSDERVWTVRVDAATGRELPEKGRGR